MSRRIRTGIGRRLSHLAPDASLRHTRALRRWAARSVKPRDSSPGNVQPVWEDQLVAVDDGLGDVDEFSSVPLRVRAKEFERSLLVEVVVSAGTTSACRRSSSRAPSTRLCALTRGVLRSPPITRTRRWRSSPARPAGSRSPRRSSAKRRGFRRRPTPRGHVGRELQVVEAVGATSSAGLDKR